MEDFKVIEWQGLWDMPSRRGDTVYDWGDALQPLIDDEDIVWNGRKFKLKALFDKRITGKTFEQKKAEIAALEKFTLHTPLRDCEVWIEDFKVTFENSICAVCVFSFYEPKPNFETSLPVKSNTGTTIDGYRLSKDLGIAFKFKNETILAELKDEATTVFKSGKLKSKHRELSEIELHCFSKDVAKIQYLISKSGLREIKYEGRSYMCFFTKGFKVKNNTSGFYYTIKLSVYEVV